MAHPCQITQASSQPVLSVRTVTAVQELPAALGRVYSSIAQYLGELGEQPAGPPFTAYYNMDRQRLDVAIGFPVSRPLPGRLDIQPGEIPAGPQGVCLHTGPYNEVGRAYEALTAFVKDQEYSASGVAYEFYLNDPTQTPPQELQTRIVFPLLAAR